MCFGCSHRDGSFEYPQHVFWLRNKKWGPANGVMGWSVVIDCGISLFYIETIAYLDLGMHYKHQCLGESIFLFLTYLTLHNILLNSLLSQLAACYIYIVFSFSACSRFLPLVEHLQYIFKQSL